MIEWAQMAVAPLTRSESGGRIRRLCAIPGRTLARSATGIAAWIEGIRSQRRLQMLDDRALRDLGLDRNAADRDSTSSFWRLR